MLEQLLNYDTELFLYLNNLGSSTYDGFWLLVTNKFASIPLYAVLLYLIYKKLGWKALLILIIVITLMITFTDQITNLFKSGIQRPRPCREASIAEFVRFIAPRCGRYGFFSGHSSNSMAVAVFAGLLLRPYYRKLIFFMLFWSAIVAYSRIYVGVHYPLDIICGMTFGAFSGFMFYKIQAYLIKRILA
jgi:undecaprenyl-diphosphatase